jgi:DUF1365 family protein
MFYIDIDQVDFLAKQIHFLGYNRFNLFSFYDKDHFKVGDASPINSVRLNLNKFLAESRINFIPSKVMLLTNLRILGYVFNPVSFYYCFDEENNVKCVVAEVSNTFGEMKMYLVNDQKEGRFENFLQKHFYISPFSRLNDYLSLSIGLPAENLKIFINNLEGEELKVKTMLSGEKQSLTNKRLLIYFLRFPFVTLQIIFLIHWQALKLWMKGVKFYRKSENKHMQTGLYYSKK